MTPIYLFVILFLSTAFTFADTHRLLRLSAGTEGIGPEYRRTGDNFYFSGAAMTRFDFASHFSNADSSRSPSFKLCPQIEVGRPIPLKNQFMLAPFLGTALSLESYVYDSGFGINYSTQFRTGIDLIWMREDVPFLNSGIFVAMDDRYFYGIGLRMGVTVVRSAKVTQKK